MVSVDVKPRVSFRLISHKPWMPDLSWLEHTYDTGYTSERIVGEVGAGGGGLIERGGDLIN